MQWWPTYKQITLLRCESRQLEIGIGVAAQEQAEG